MTELHDDHTGEMAEAGYPKADWEWLSYPEVPKEVFAFLSWQYQMTNFLTGYHARSEVLLADAFDIAHEVHDGQFDKCGEPYIEHVMAVAIRMKTTEEKIVAILHDAIEDCAGGIQKQAELALRIQQIFGKDIAAAVVLLTRYRPIYYGEYLRGMFNNPLAMRVKLADLAENMRDDRLAKLEPKQAGRLRSKYTLARHLIETALKEYETCVTKSSSSSAELL